jgi:drug/metabolite transporter (DMT)-like permease
VIGLLGVAIAAGEWPTGGKLVGYLLIFAGTAALIAATLVAKKFETSPSILVSLGIQSSVSTILFLPLAALDGGLMPIWEWYFLAAVVWFVVLPTLWGYGMYWVCLKRTSATRVTSLIYLTPPVTIIWAWMMFGEDVSLQAITGCVLCGAGAWMASKQA